jgi:hypothetical protein
MENLVYGRLNPARDVSNSTGPAEDIEIAGMGIALQALLNGQWAI